jgi:ornithine carbamoyltransferase
VTLLDLRGKDLISLQEWETQEIDFALHVARQLKEDYVMGRYTDDILRAKTFFMLFFSTSTRTRNSFEAALTQLGGHAHFLDPSTMQLSVGETAKDTIKVLSQYGEGMGLRVLGKVVNFEFPRGNEIIREYARYSDIPIINMECDSFHPCQSLADIMTLSERVKDFKGKKFVMSWAYQPHVRRPPAVPRSNALNMTRMGFDVVLAHPPGYELDDFVLDQSRINAEESGGSFSVVKDMDEAFKNADVVYPLDWTSLTLIKDGIDNEKAHRDKHKDWICNMDRIKLCNKNAIYMHPLPAARNHEVSDEVIDSSHSVVYEQAGNRLHAQKAVLSLTMR